MRRVLTLVVLMLMMFGCRGPQDGPQVPPSGDTVQDGKTVTLAYTLTVEENLLEQVTDADPLIYVQGQNRIFNTLSDHLVGMTVGEEKDIALPPEGAFGPIVPDAIQRIPRSVMPADVELKPGMSLRTKSNTGKPVIARVLDFDNDTVILDLNHPLAGKTLNFHVKVLAIR